ncbi:putative NDP-sugar dehydrogenase [Listeria fleischmannii 1991]|uniref:UDP-glucose 6-dehydrogenase tuaD n=2 Tax=Listeria fleischmannii TaxID=1069827 RepID=A0A2X3HH11_9LIST|nr:nucleotide sugar dehydrogenase [Listeria fleischmannii]EMG28749.1 putative NDP-sugar dehydrogenase [Listeria fleischmannii subsp. fleischmannii LU2006-1]KMT58234.1 putative NDP-sugar dehydrogenase [Listeria fleischmannii 1991]SQC70474.1 UDP-glucose 6-dehydrogenase tuaD [Listeria fleischmannii subsp. fleischmannii]
METLLKTKEQQLQKFKEKTAKIGVIGLGYVGLPLAIELADAGFEVVGIDIDKAKVASLNEGKSHILDVPEERVAQAVKNHQFYATDEFAILGQLDAVSVCVPTPLNENQEPDISYMTFTAEKILTHMKNPLLILLESTTYPGTTRELFANRFEAAGKHVNEDYFLCFSPERVDPGNEHYQTKSIPKVIGGITEESSELAEALYGSVLDEIVLVSSPETAEMSKLLENTFRSVNIAFVNEMALMCERMGLDIWETIDAAATKPFGFMPFYPGPGVGGHCIPLDPMYLHWKGKQSKFFNKFIETAQEINMNMPYRVVDKIKDALDEQMKSLRGAKVLLMGAAYKADINDVRESPTLDIYEILVEYGVDVVVADPFVSSFRDNEGETVPVIDPKNCDFKVYDCAVVLTKHSTVNYEKLLDESNAIVDMRYIYRDNDSNKIFKIGGGK